MEINKVKPSMKSIPFISVYNLTERTERSFSKIKLFASDISLLTFVVFPIAEDKVILLLNTRVVVIVPILIVQIYFFTSTPIGFILTMVYLDVLGQ